MKCSVLIMYLRNISTLTLPACLCLSSAPFLLILLTMDFHSEPADSGNT